MVTYPRTRLTTIAATALAAGFRSVESFRPPSLASLSPPRTQMPTTSETKKPLTIMFRVRCENKYYQLEELEDADNCTTELFLKEDGTVDIGETDGPLFTKAVGNWEIKENAFAMTITKTFTSGNENNDMGEFSFDVERVFEGDMMVVGGTEVAINGKIFAEDIITEKHEKEVGFFNMIDGTEQRLERRPDARPKATGVMPSPINSNDVKDHDGIPKDWLQPQEEVQPQIDPALSSFGGSNGYGQQQQQQPQGISAYGSGSFGQESQGYGGGYGQQQQQQEAASSWGSGSGYGQQQQQQQQQQPQSGGISEYGGGSFGQESQSYGGGSSGYGYGQPQQQQASTDPGPPSFANFGQPQQQEESNDPGPPSFADYGQQQQQQASDEYDNYSDPQTDGYYDGNNYNGGGGS
mmetsp:Transcript_18569/g.42908  ORF Transcript_18569/g.42908 Transcript_18569/m.42908 type:complete len:408 (-) Transcript_18569:375-1598(-)